jgi:hypothetical protein
MRYQDRIKMESKKPIRQIESTYRDQAKVYDPSGRRRFGST